MRACPTVAGPGLVAGLRKNDGTARLAEPLCLVHPVTIAHANGTSPTPSLTVSINTAMAATIVMMFMRTSAVFFPLSTAGLGLLVFVKARNITGVADAIAAGYQYASDEKS